MGIIRQHMKALLFPFYPNNPYQPNLVRELTALDCTVDGQSAISPLALLKSLCRGYNIYHLHWTDPYILSEKLPVSIIKSAVFVVFLLLLKLKGSRLVWTIHNFGKHEKNQQGFELFIHRIIAKLADGIIAHSKVAKKIVTEKYRLANSAAKIHIIPHGNYLGNYPDDLSRTQARAAQQLTDDNIAFLFLGQIRQYKGVPELISAFTKISPDNGRLIIAGRPFDLQTETELDRLVKQSDDIQFQPGFVPNEMVQQYMKAGDVVVFPFRDILTSGSILLAMSFGKAIIVPALESLEEIIAVGGAITFAPDDPLGLEAALSTALESDLEQLGQRNLEAAKDLSWDRIAQQTAEVYAAA